AAENLDPSGVLAGAAALSPAALAADVDLRTGLGVGKEARTQPHLHVAEQLAQHRLEGAFEIGKGDAFADDEPLELLEHRGVAEVELVPTVDTVRHDDADRRRKRLHV